MYAWFVRRAHTDTRTYRRWQEVVLPHTHLRVHAVYSPAKSWIIFWSVFWNISVLFRDRYKGSESVANSQYKVPLINVKKNVFRIFEMKCWSVYSIVGTAETQLKNTLRERPYVYRNSWFIRLIKKLTVW